jgi:kynurenine formamidase
MRIGQGIAAAALLAALSCGTARQAAPGRAIDPAKLVDLSYPFDEKTVYWPNAAGFRHRKDVWATTPAGFWYAAGEFTTSEHGGTHMDSPIHFAQGKWTLDQVPVANLVAPACVIDIAAKAAQDRDYRASRDDIVNWEQAHGTIAAGSIVVFRTGWGKHWPNRKEYLGNDVPGDVSNLHFPGLRGKPRSCWWSAACLAWGSIRPAWITDHPRISSRTRRSTARTSTASRTSPMPSACRPPAQRYSRCRSRSPKARAGRRV